MNETQEQWHTNSKKNTFFPFSFQIKFFSPKSKRIPNDVAKKSLQRKQVNLKLIPGVDRGKPDVLQLIGYNIADIEVKEAWESPARLLLSNN